MERLTLVLDLRQEFSGYLTSAKVCMKTLIHEKLVHKPTCEIAVIGFGSLDTSNVFPSSQSGEGEVLTISPLEEASLHALEAIDRFSGGHSRCSLSSALKRAAEMMSGAQKRKTAKKRVIVLSTFEGMSENEKEACKFAISIDYDISYEFICCVEAHGDEEHSVNQIPGVNVLEVQNGYELQTCFPTKVNRDGHVIYSGTLLLGSDIGLDVKIVPKTKRELFPPLGNTTGEFYSESLSHGWVYSSTPTGKTDELFREDDIEQTNPVDVDDRVRGFKFGKSLVPLSGPLLEMTKVSIERGVRLLGFIDESDVSPDLFLGTSKVLFADKSKANSVRALHSLVRAMLSMKKVALLRLVLRAGSNTKIIIGFPGTGNPSFLILKEAPFMEDVTFMNVRPLLETCPDAEDEADMLVDANMMADSELLPDRTSNPILHRAISCFSEKFLNRDIDDTSYDTWLEHVFGRDIRNIISNTHI